MAGCSRMGVSPAPSTAGTARRSKGSAQARPTARKAAVRAASTAATGDRRSGRERPTERAATTATIDDNHAQNNSEPAIPPQSPASR